MCMIPDKPGIVHVVRVIPPGGPPQDVSRYGLTRMGGLREACGLRACLSRNPTGDDPEHHRELWIDLVWSGYRPQDCSVELVESITQAEMDEIMETMSEAEMDARGIAHCWRRILLMEPRVRLAAATHAPRTDIGV